MKQKVSSVILAFLVLMSLILTYQLWYGDKKLEEIDEDVYEYVFFEEPRPLTEVIAPAQMVLVEGNATYLLKEGDILFAGLWTAVSEALQSLEVYDYDTLEAGMEPCLNIYFQPPLPIGTGTSWLKDDRYRELAQLHLWYKDDEVWASLVETEENPQNMCLLLPADLQPKLREAAAELRAANTNACKKLTDSDLAGLPAAVRLPAEKEIYVPLRPAVMAALQLKREHLDQDRLLKTFFVDRSLVRRIQEKSGATIYADGEKGLRLDEGVEYSDPQQDTAPVTFSYPAALQAASKYLCTHGGWPEGLRLKELFLSTKIPAARRVYVANWQYYYQGFPLLDKHDAASVLFNDGGLVAYQRFVALPLASATERQPTALFNEALLAAVTLHRSEHPAAETPLFLEELELAYRVTGPGYQLRAAPVWHIKLDGQSYFLNAWDLSTLESDPHEP